MSKINFHRTFKKVSQLRAYLPDTARGREPQIAWYLERYPAIFIKPNGGGRGIGVTKAWKKGALIYYVKEKGTPRTANSVRSLSKQLGLKKNPHIVQQAIHLAKVDGRPFDIRLMMMRDQLKRWKYIGMIAKVAGNQSVITNVARGKGYVMSIDHALQKSLGLTGARASEKKNEMIRLAKVCTRIYSKSRYDWQIGYDLAIDKDGKVWFIEINPTVPAHGLFRNETSTYRRIKQIAAFHKRQK
ncbi:YheC/YheD family protein [Paenibacillus athensensis]|uniref:YheC/YheD family protein n=1 Tax=Paenibacillus athensensis TaxID=1967502 RepID=UPI001430ED19|nr:YheC/YheD family protein [Paenibacillus athensensis]MCD1257703.1 YheC/YheD family protein [Paenibacillus athensensis]